MGQALLWAVTAFSAVGVVALAAVLYQLLRQQGRLLIRLERLEARVQIGNQPAPPTPQGLVVGTEIPAFELPDLTGELVRREDYLGRRVLLVHWSPGCGYCARIADELAQQEAKLHQTGTELVLVSYGEAEPNLKLAEEHGLAAPVLLQEPGRSIEAFRGLGTPVAYLVAEEGKIAAPLARGANEVPELVRTLSNAGKSLASERLLAESRLERDGLREGTKAPDFELEDVRGSTVSLADYRGRPLLLVFSDPECGPCSALLPDLAQLQSGAEIVMVSRGDPEENRAKAEEHGLEFPIVVQQGWKVSKDYGIFATPVAFLIDEDGVIAKDVARGKDEIVALASAARKEVPLTHQPA